MSLLTSYLDNRRQLVDVNGSFSDVKPIVHGIPQGSVLGPLLFIIYVNDLYFHLLPHKAVFYADDTTLISRDGDRNEALSLSEGILRETELWFTVNKLKINVDKTQRIAFSLSCDGAESAKLLGVVIDSSLKWSQHVEYLCRRLSGVLFMFRQLKRVLDTDALLSAYYAFFYPHINYGILLWGNSTAASRAFIMQKKVVRIITNVGFREHCRPLFLKLSMLTLPSLFIYNTLTEVHSKSSGLFKNSDFHDYPTRSADLLRPPKFRLTASKRNTLQLSFYNKLPSIIRALPERAFKLEIKNLLKRNCYYSVEESLSPLFCSEAH